MSIRNQIVRTAAIAFVTFNIKCNPSWVRKLCSRTTAAMIARLGRLGRELEDRLCFNMEQQMVEHMTAMDVALDRLHMGEDVSDVMGDMMEDMIATTRAWQAINHALLEKALLERDSDDEFLVHPDDVGDDELNKMIDEMVADQIAMVRAGLSAIVGDA